MSLYYITRTFLAVYIKKTEDCRAIDWTLKPTLLVGEDTFDPELLDYIAKTIVKSFSLQERFDLTVQDKLPF